MDLGAYGAWFASADGTTQEHGDGMPQERIDGTTQEHGDGDDDGPSWDDIMADTSNVGPESDVRQSSLSSSVVLYMLAIASFIGTIVAMCFVCPGPCQFGDVECMVRSADAVGRGVVARHVGVAGLSLTGLFSVGSGIAALVKL